MDTISNWWSDNAAVFVLGSLAWTGVAAVVLHVLRSPIFRQAPDGFEPSGAGRRTLTLSSTDPPATVLSPDGVRSTGVWSMFSRRTLP